ncbi:MAG: hypothetical protein FWF46_02980 [Oscillospiraceae bacterium]|nr:hypothetical protein [Oscillospiraceae bacterium]
MKKILSLILLLLLYIIPSLTYYATDYTLNIQYNDKIQINASSNIIFDVQNFDPGDKIAKDIVITNSGPNPVEVYLYQILVSDPNELLSQVKFYIYETNSDGSIVSVIFSGKLKDIVQTSLGQFTTGTKKTYKIVMEFNSNAGNQYQGATFSANLVFSVKGLEVQENPDVPNNTVNTNDINDANNAVNTNEINDANNTVNTNEINNAVNTNNINNTSNNSNTNISRNTTVLGESGVATEYWPPLGTLNNTETNNSDSTPTIVLGSKDTNNSNNNCNCGCCSCMACRLVGYNCYIYWWLIIILLLVIAILVVYIIKIKREKE